MPSGIGFVVRLTEINFSYNKLTELPPDIVNLRGTHSVLSNAYGIIKYRFVGLIKLDVTHNSLKGLPKMGELRKLQFLYAQHNDIEELPDFEGCENIQQLHFGNNFIKVLVNLVAKAIFLIKIF